jgi:hypothetical protein
MPISPIEYLKPYAQHQKTHASTKHAPISPTYHHKICACTIPCTKPIPCINHASTPQHVPSTIYHNKCIKHAPKLYHQPCTNHVHKPCTCTSTMYINTIACINHIPSHAIHDVPINKYMNQQCISPRRPQPTRTIHPLMFLNSYTKALKHMLQACSSISPICNLLTQYTKTQV